MWRLIITIVCLLFEQIANDLVNDTQVYLLFVAFIRYLLHLFVSVLFANVNASSDADIQVKPRSHQGV